MLFSMLFRVFVDVEQVLRSALYVLGCRLFINGRVVGCNVAGSRACKGSNGVNMLILGRIVVPFRNVRNATIKLG